MGPNAIRLVSLKEKECCMKAEIYRKDTSDHRGTGWADVLAGPGLPRIEAVYHQQHGRILLRVSG